jgi:hypothetical protein
MTKTIQFFDPQKGFYKTEVSEELAAFPHLVNECSVLGLSILREEDDHTLALGLEQHGGAVSPWFDDLKQLEGYCLQPGTREEMRSKKSRLLS